MLFHHRLSFDYKLEVGVLVLGRVEIQRNKGIEIMIHKYFVLSLKLVKGKLRNYF